MPLRYGSAVLLALMSWLLAACAIVDQFESRVYSSNIKSQNAMNQETLANLVRASRFQPMNFVAITQVAGGQTQTLNTGLPTVTFGPLQTAAQHMYQVSNSVSSVATGSFQTNPLVSTVFQSAMLSPVSARTVALLTNSHPREPVLYTLIDYVTLSDGNFVVRFGNDPLRRTPKGCFEKWKSRAALARDESSCNYPSFIKLFQLLLDAGLAAELQPSATAPGKDAPLAPGRICFDRSRAFAGYDADPVCGSKRVQNARLAIDGLGSFDLTIGFRSPIAAFRFLGTLYGEDRGGGYSYYTGEALRLRKGDEPFVNIVSGASEGCYTTVNFDGEQLCVPASSRNTALLFSLLQELRNLSTQSTDLNSAFTVRVAN